MAGRSIRKARTRFLLNSIGAVKLMKDGVVTLYMDNNGVVRMRKPTSNMNVLEKILAMKRLLQGLDKNQRLSMEKKLEFKQKLKNKIEELQKKYGITDEQIQKAIKEKEEKKKQKQAQQQANKQE